MDYTKERSLFLDKILFTILMMLLYMVGRNIPLYGVDTSKYMDFSLDAQTILFNTIGGDINRYSILALGISPYIISSMTIQMVVACLNSDTKSRISPKKLNYAIMFATLTIGFIQAIIRTQELEYRDMGDDIYIVMVIDIIQMILGALLILWIASRNKKYGIGGQTSLIFINIVDGLLKSIKGHSLLELSLPLFISLMLLLIALFMENSLVQIPVQRISIHNIYADKNYVAFKLNPIGIMPIMFATGFFMLPQMLISLLFYVFPGSTRLEWWQSNLVLGRPVGIVAYIIIIYLLTVIFALIFINPSEMTDQLLKSGDSLLNIHAGKDTKKYLVRTLVRTGFISATVMSIGIGIPMLLQLNGRIDSSLAMLPSSVMMVTGIWCSLYDEMKSVRSFDKYQPFV